MTSDTSHRPVSPLRARMIEDMTVRGFSEKTRSDYIRNVRAFAGFIGRSPDTATAEDLRLFQLHQRQIGMQAPSINGAVSALRFFFTVTLDRPDLARRLTVVPYPRRIPAVLSGEEVTLLLRAATAPKYKAAFATAYGAGLRVSEVVALKVGDIDSERMLLRVEQARRQLPLQGLPPQRPAALSHDDARARRVHPTLSPPRLAKRVPPHPSLRIARQRHLQGQHRARQGTDRRASGSDGSAGRARPRKSVLASAGEASNAGRA
jgi:integrase/recombinase XerD